MESVGKNGTAPVACNYRTMECVSAGQLLATYASGGMCAASVFDSRNLLCAVQLCVDGTKWLLNVKVPAKATAKN